jgi:hypothetical protein
MKIAKSTTKAVQGTTLAFQRVNNVQGRDRLALGVFGVGNRVTDNTLKEGLEHTSGIVIDHFRAGLVCGEPNAWTQVRHTGWDTLDTSSAGKSPNRRLCDTLDVVTKDLAVTLRTTLAEALAALAA